MLEVSGIRKSYGKRQILDGAGFLARPRDCVGIVGANGCGKTTLLSIVAGAARADGGSVRFDGEELLGMPRAAARIAAYVPQENPLMEELSVRDNLLLWYRGDKRAMESDLVSGPAALLGIGPMLRQRAGKLSGGMKKRLSIACALADHAPCLIMDEPGAALDLECKETIRGYLADYGKGGGIVVLTSHEMEELSLCTRMYVLRDGKLEEIETGLTAGELMKRFR